MRRRIIQGGAAVLALGAAGARAQSKVVHLVVPYGAGAVQDTLARMIAVEFGQALGTTVVVENRAGAGGTIGAAAVARAPADGTTLIVSAASHTIAGSLYSKLPYDPIKDFTAVAHMGRAGYVLMVPADVPVKNVAEFIKWVKASPGKYNYASAGNGSATHLAMAYFAGRAGLEIVHIPLKSTGDAVNEVVAGRVQAVIAGSIGALPFQKDPRVKLLATTGLKRSRFLPDLPTVAESGLPGYEFDSWFGLLGPAGIAPAEASRINLAMVKVLHDPVVVERLSRQGVETATMNPDQFARLLRDDFVKMANVVKISGAKVD